MCVCVVSSLRLRIIIMIILYKDGTVDYRRFVLRSRSRQKKIKKSPTSLMECRPDGMMIAADRISAAVKTKLVDIFSRKFVDVLAN